MHRATSWEEHHRMALCTAAAPIPSAGAPPTAGGPLPINRFRHDRAPVLRCRGRDAPRLRCGAMGCGPGPASVVYPQSECAKEPRCAAYYSATFANWTFCIAAGSRRVARVTLEPRAWRAFCSANASTVLARCEAGDGPQTAAQSGAPDAASPRREKRARHQKGARHELAKGSTRGAGADGGPSAQPPPARRLRFVADVTDAVAAARDAARDAAPRLAIVVLSSRGAHHARLRCFQRTAIEAQLEPARAAE
eukprot:3956660-Prymnesium_polylepis.1